MGKNFAGLAGVGVIVCVVTVIMAFVRSGEPKDDFVWWDSWNIGRHWRGFMQIGAAMITIGLIGQLVVAITT